MTRTGPRLSKNFLIRPTPSSQARFWPSPPNSTPPPRHSDPPLACGGVSLSCLALSWCRRRRSRPNRSADSSYRPHPCGPLYIPIALPPSPPPPLLARRLPHRRPLSHLPMEAHPSAVSTCTFYFDARLCPTHLKDRLTLLPSGGWFVLEVPPRRRRFPSSLSLTCVCLLC